MSRNEAPAEAPSSSLSSWAPDVGTPPPRLSPHYGEMGAYTPVGEATSAHTPLYLPQSPKYTPTSPVPTIQAPSAPAGPLYLSVTPPRDSTPPTYLPPSPMALGAYAPTSPGGPPPPPATNALYTPSSPTGLPPPGRVGAYAPDAYTPETGGARGATYDPTTPPNPVRVTAPQSAELRVLDFAAAPGAAVATPSGGGRCRLLLYCDAGQLLNTPACQDALHSALFLQRSFCGQEVATLWCLAADHRGGNDLALPTLDTPPPGNDVQAAVGDALRCAVGAWTSLGVRSLLQPTHAVRVLPNEVWVAARVLLAAPEVVERVARAHARFGGPVWCPSRSVLDSQPMYACTAPRLPEDLRRTFARVVRRLLPPPEKGGNAPAPPLDLARPAELVTLLKRNAKLRADVFRAAPCFVDLLPAKRGWKILYHGTTAAVARGIVAQRRLHASRGESHTPAQWPMLGGAVYLGDWAKATRHALFDHAYRAKRTPAVVRCLVRLGPLHGVYRGVDQARVSSFHPLPSQRHGLGGRSRAAVTPCRAGHCAVCQRLGLTPGLQAFVDHHSTWQRPFHPGVRGLGQPKPFSLDSLVVPPSRVDETRWALRRTEWVVAREEAVVPLDWAPLEIPPGLAHQTRADTFPFEDVRIASTPSLL